MKNNWWWFLLVFLILALGLLLVFLVWKKNSINPINTISQIPGVELRINNRKDMNAYLNKVGFWQRDNWEGVEGNETGKKMKKLTVVLTDEYVMPFRDEKEKGEQSGKMRIEGEEMIVWIQIAKRSAEENIIVQKWFIKMLSSPDNMYEAQNVIESYLELYKDRPSFFVLK